MALSLPASGCQSSKQRDMEDLGSLPTFLADSALISVVLKENLMFWLFWAGEGRLVRVGKKLGEGSSELLVLFLNKVSLKTCAFVPNIRWSGDSRADKPCFSCFIKLPFMKLQFRYVKITFIF